MYSKQRPERAWNMEYTTSSTTSTTFFEDLSVAERPNKLTLAEPDAVVSLARLLRVVPPQDWGPWPPELQPAPQHE